MFRQPLCRHFLILFVLLVSLWSKPTCLQAASPTSAAAIDAYLQKYNSPMAGSGAAYMRWGQYFNVDPRFIVAISAAESTLGQSTHNTYNAWGWFLKGSFWTGFTAGVDTDTKTYTDAPDFVSGQGINMGTGWEDGIFWVTHTISTGYLAKGLTTVDAIAPVYCTDGTANWIKNVKTSLSELGGDQNSLAFPGASSSVGNRPVLVPGSQWLGGQGVDAYDNGSDVNIVWGNSYIGSTYVGLAYQCVELPQRLYTTRGWYNGSFGANAVDIYAAAGRLGMESYSNGTGHVPVPGDMVVLAKSGTLGHVAVVDTVDNSNVNVVEQNWPGSGDRHSFARSGTNGSFLADRGSYIVLGIVHSPKNPNTNGGDTTPPTVTITSGQTNGATYNTAQRVAWHIDDGNGSGLKSWGQAWDSDPGYSQFNTSDGYLDLPTGTHTLNIDVIDNAGNHKDWTFGPYTYNPVTQVGQKSDGTIDQRFVDCYNRVGASIVGSVWNNNTVHTVTGNGSGDGSAQDFIDANNAHNIIIAKNGATNAYDVSGNTWGWYAGQSFASGSVGFPNGDAQQITASTGGFDTAGAVQTFEGGWVYDSKYGTHKIPQAMISSMSLSTLVKIINGTFGFPTSDEQTATPSPQGTTGTVIHFENGVICSTVKVGGHGVSGDIFQKYAALGGSGSQYGFPISDPYSYEGGTRQDFEGGFLTSGVTDTTSILWKNAAGSCSVWTIGLDDTIVSTPAYGPYGDWQAQSLAVGADNKTRLLWKNAAGSCSVWTIGLDDTIVSTPAYGPYGDWQAKSLAIGN